MQDYTVAMWRKSVRSGTFLRGEGIPSSPKLYNKIQKLKIKIKKRMHHQDAILFLGGQIQWKGY